MAHEPIPEGPRGRILQAQLATLLERGRGEDCLELSEINGLITALDLEEEEVDDLYQSIESQGTEISDDCAREGAEEATYVNAELADVTTDALQLFMNEVGRHRLLTAEEEVKLAKRIEGGDRRAKDRMINANLRL